MSSGPAWGEHGRWDRDPCDEGTGTTDSKAEVSKIKTGLGAAQWQRTFLAQVMPWISPAALHAHTCAHVHTPELPCDLVILQLDVPPKEKTFVCPRNVCTPGSATHSDQEMESTRYLPTGDQPDPALP